MTGDNGTLTFWDYKTGTPFQHAEDVPQPGSLDAEAGVFCSTFDLTGTRLITGGADKTIKARFCSLFILDSPQERLITAHAVYTDLRRTGQLIFIYMYYVAAAPSLHLVLERPRVLDCTLI